jgi:nicotinamide-nucleotide amidase
VLDREALEYIRSLFARRKRPMPKQNELQAMFPEGSRVVFNRHGTAPGIDLEVSREGRSSSRVICLPGVPAEMVEMWNGSVRKSLEEFLGSERRVVCRRLIHCFGAGESQVESMLPDMIRRGRQPTVGITASKATITLRIAAEGATEEACLAAMEPTVRTIYECLGSLVFGEGDEQLQHAIVKLLRQHGKTLATAEYGTSGLLGCWLSSVENGCDAYGGGLVLTTEATSVEAAAQQCREQFGADFGLAVALPCPALPTADVESGGRKLGAIVLATADGVQRQEISTAWHPALVGIVAAKTALNLLRLRLIQ